MTDQLTVTLKPEQWQKVLTVIHHELISVEVESRRRLSSHVRKSFARQAVDLQFLHDAIDSQLAEAIASRKAPAE